MRLIQDAILRLEDTDWLLLQNETNGIAEAIELAAQKGKRWLLIAPADEGCLIIRYQGGTHYCE